MSSDGSDPRPRNRVPLPLAVALALLACALLGALASPLGYRLGWWGAGFALLELMRWAVYAAIGAGIVALLALVVLLIRRGNKQGIVLAVIVALLAGGVVLNALSWRSQARSVPPIHDISTDTADPPAFVAIRPLREDAPNPPGYAGEDTARQQQAAYPDIAPRTVSLSKEAAHEAALEAVREMGWTLIESAQGEGRIEAVDTSFWYGFKDDIVIRITADPAGSVIDVRSKSRVGRSDLGANAERIRAFFTELERQI